MSLAPRGSVSRRLARKNAATLAGLLRLVLLIAPALFWPAGAARAQIQGTTWYPIGPAPIDGFGSFPRGVSGRASAIAVNPYDRDDIWMGTAAGGVWHSTDGGQHWRPTSDRQEALAIGAIALDDCSNGPGFGSPSDWTPGGFGFNPGTRTFLADVDRDGRADAISLVSRYPYQTLEVRRSDGATFLPPEDWSPGGFGFNPGARTFFADVDRDGRADAISLVSRYPYQTVEVRRSDGTTFLPPEDWTPGGFGFDPGTQTFFADVDGDGRADAISLVSRYPYQTLQVRRSDGTTFLPPEEWTPNLTGFNAGSQTFFADVDGDGKADAISLTSRFPYQTLEVRRSNGTTFLPPQEWTPDLTGFNAGSQTFFADVDGDGRADAISLASRYPYKTLQVRRSDGTTFLPAEDWTPDIYGFNAGSQTFFADVDRDGRADAISLISGIPYKSLEVRRALWKGCSTIYAGTGENAIRRDTYYGAGFLIGSVDRRNPANISWVQRTGAPAFDFRRGSINDVVLDPTTSGATKRIFITLSSGVTVSSSEATVTAPEPPSGYGIYRSDDRGFTWSKLSVSGADGTRPTDLERDPGNPSVLYAGFLGRGIFKTTTGGVSWCPLNPGVPLPAGCPAVAGLPNVASNFDFVEIAIAPSNSSVLYASFGACPDRLLAACRPLLFRSDNAGSSWSLRAANPGTDTRPGADLSPPFFYSRYTHALAVDPRDENTLLWGGLRIWRSTDGGLTFLEADGTVPQNFWTIVHLDGHELVFHPSIPGAAYTTNDGGFAVSNDGGISWTPRNDELQITGFQGLGSSPLTDAVIGASQDNGIQLWHGSRRWTSLGPVCDGGFALLDWDDVMTMYASSNCNSFLRSIDGGASWRAIVNGITPGEPRMFYSPIVQGPSPPHPLFAGTNRLYRSMDDGATWTAVSPILATGPSDEIVGGQNAITAIAVAPRDRVYVGYYGGQVFRSNPAPCATAGCWIQANNGLPPEAPITRFAVHPRRREIAWVTVSGFGAGPKVFKTVDGGASWKPSADGLPPGVPANTISVEPGTPDNVFVGLDSSPRRSSLYKSTDGGARWKPFSDGLPNAPVYEISIDETHRRIFAATHGRGAYVIGKGFVRSFRSGGRSGPRDLALSGQNFPPNQACSVQILQSNGKVCAAGSIDATGGTIKTDSNGVLTTDKPSFWKDKPQVWACLDGHCVGDKPISVCSVGSGGDKTGDPTPTVVLSCGGESATAQVRSGPALESPPSSFFALNLAGLGKGGELQLVVSVEEEAQSRSLCSVPVRFSTEENSEAVLRRARDTVNASPTCVSNKVRAVLETRTHFGSEDEFPVPPRLRFEASGVRGRQLIAALHARPGQATGAGLEVGGLGIPILNQFQLTRVSLETPAAGAAGGRVTLVEHSDLGVCALTVTTVSGQSGAQIAAALAAAGQAPGIPGPHSGCPSENNPRDLVVRDGALISAAANRVEVRSDDRMVGIDVRSADLANVHPSANAGQDRTIPVTGQDRVSVRLDASASVDPDSTPWTRDDIVAFEWFEVSGDGLRLLGRGEQIDVSLGPGVHRIRLRVRDKAGLEDVAEALVTVEGNMGSTLKS